MTFYNEERYQKRLNSLAPLEYRHQAVGIIFYFFTVYLTGRVQ
ncbi:IS3 family transposase [Virgibacillus pantothenticus]|nr:IS3 family transposase [Virgibacillus pantothenticus]